MKFIAGLIIGLATSQALADEARKVVECPAGAKITLQSGDNIVADFPCPVDGKVTATLLPGGGAGGGRTAGEQLRTPCHLKGPWPFGGGSFGAAVTKGQIICPPKDQDLPCVLNDPQRGLTSIQPR